MNLLAVLSLNLALIAAVMLGLWWISLRIRNASIVDLFWGFGFVLIAWTSYFASGSDSSRGLLLAILTTAWGLRLTLYLSWRNHRKPEDYRYRAMRERHGDRFPSISLWTVFGLQGFIMWFVSFPLQAASGSTGPLTWLDVAGGVVWLIGWLFETVGDWQLARFKSDPHNRGQVMSRGLWRYTRHPNYFGDFLVMWGFYFIAISGQAWWTIGSPLLMSFLLIQISGVKLLEKSLIKNRPDYQAYTDRTNAFFPWRPRTHISNMPNQNKDDAEKNR